VADLWITQPGWGLCREPFFSGAVGSVQRCWWLARLPCTGTTYRKRTPDIRGLAWEAYVSCLSGFLLQGVHQFESARLSDMSNRLFVAAIK
jgi:hypothetical protein